MNILLTGAWRTSRESILEIKSIGHKLKMMQNENDSLPCDYRWVEGVVCNNLFQYHPIELFNNLKYIQLTSAGLDRIPTEDIKIRNIVVNRATGVYSIPMAEFAVGGIKYI